MANRSDFFNAKLPRYLKRMISMAEAAGHLNAADARSVRQAFIDAHATHVGFKLKRSSEHNADSADE